MDGYLLFNFDGTITTIPYANLDSDKVAPGSYLYSFQVNIWHIRVNTNYSYWQVKQPEDVPKQHRAALLIYS